MQHSDTMTRSDPVAADREESKDAGAWMAAAVTAALIEYRRLVQGPGDDGTSMSDTKNWRMVACWERLRGRA